ncbi:peptidase [Flavobacterium branchiophilum]|uniref:Putative metalloprotease n=1 Tax=Flavobacterium branchiophilum TaxID=55197 RepID=A0A543G3R6_9FLAO|nr:M48 family metalloprotease [Flavobacterium branchiophilum]OXA82179.1 peptidase [Flavobacterium branchiophilum] [Flavobacterium branchiophilum NBRC 15030 = ATCC 35035]TQM40736.1 putative metalloprotease [Flavobacterium branchiophilum]GEM55553.1 peptidase M48 [Flavobacterium branchiophilum NBRC 15030 = ATCC 35035]
MKTKSILVVLGVVTLGVSQAQAQINLGERALGAVQKGIAGFTFSDADAAKLSKDAVVKMDAENKVAGPKDAYAIRLEKVFGKHKNENGLTLNYKVYLTKDVNAFATADGSVRVFSGLMDIMDDNELLAVIGHEIGHVANHDSRDAAKAAYQKEALIDAVASQSDKVAAVTDGQLGKIGSAMIDSKHSRKQESEADDYSYEFMKRNKYNVNAVASAFNILATMSQGTEASFLDKMMSSHPDPKDRADKARQRAEADGLFSPYVKQTKTANKPVAKKTTPKKK